MKTLNHLNFLFLLAVFGLLVGCTQSKKADQADEQTTEAEENVAEDDGWIVLFDGTSTEGWRGYKKEGLPPAWSIVEGTLYIKGSGRGEAGAEDGGDILYENHKAGSLYDLIPAVPQNTKPAGEWNDVEIMVYEGTVIHRQNGEQVVEYHLWTPKWDEMIANSKFPEYNENWSQVAPEGYIGLQDHGNDCWFKDIMIKEL
jgi:hypothetical protein